MERQSYAQDISYDALQSLRGMHPAWRLLASPSAPIVISFLYDAFVAESNREIPEYILTGKLRVHLDKIAEQRDAGELLSIWADDKHRYLRKFYPAGSDEIHYDLTSSAQQAIWWVESLNARSFIGTESRLLLVFQLFHEIAEQSNEDPARRIQSLQRRKDELEDELARAKSGDIKVLQPAQIKERYLQAMNLSREILADFRAVEQNFRDLRRVMQAKMSNWDQGKGALIGDFFHNQDSIEQSDQGRSFQAFFDFLMSRAAQDEFEQTIRDVKALAPVKELADGHSASRMIHDWVAGSKHVQGTLATVSEQLRRYMDETFLKEERRINQIMKDILRAAIAVRNEPPEGDFPFLDALSPQLVLPFDRPLYTPTARLEMETGDLSYGDTEVGGESALYTHVFVDKNLLLQHIIDMLEQREEISLREVIDAHPIRFGLAELIGYLSLIQDNPNAVLLSQINEPIIWKDTDGNMRKADFCRIIFRNSGTVK